MAKSARLSGFPERLPAERVIEKAIIDTLEHTFALHGFSALNHRAVEPISQLAKDGEIDKEIFASPASTPTAPNATRWVCTSTSRCPWPAMSPTTPMS
jgi:hypothetical protein